MTLIVALFQLVLAWCDAFPQPCQSPAMAILPEVAGLPADQLCRPSGGRVLPPGERLADRASNALGGTGR